MQSRSPASPSLDDRLAREVRLGTQGMIDRDQVVEPGFGEQLYAVEKGETAHQHFLRIGEFPAARCSSWRTVSVTYGDGSCSRRSGIRPVSACHATAAAARSQRRAMRAPVEQIEIRLSKTGSASAPPLLDQRQDRDHEAALGQRGQAFDRVGARALVAAVQHRPHKVEGTVMAECVERMHDEPQRPAVGIIQRGVGRRDRRYNCFG